MLNIEDYLHQEKSNNDEENLKNIYLANISNLTNYLINLKQTKEQNKILKNQLKVQENDLKYELLLNLIQYYGQNKNVDKKVVNLDNTTTVDNSLIINNAKNITTKSFKDIESYLNILIQIVKEEELEEQYYVNIYSNNIYKYNIEILNKQINFVKNKINAEKNFNLKGSKIHNIDEELKSFLKKNTTPIKISDYISTNKNIIIEKYNKITNIKDAYSIISNQPLKYNHLDFKTSLNRHNIIQKLKTDFQQLNQTSKNALVLYNSIYKPICNYIINNNYPTIEEIKKAFDFDYYYSELEQVVNDANNYHYLATYFYQINFKNLDSYINSLIDLCHNLEKSQSILMDTIKLFCNDFNNKYKLCNLYSSIDSTIITIPANTSLIYVPLKLEIDFENKEINENSSNDFYLNYDIIKTTNNIIVKNYQVKNKIIDHNKIANDIKENKVTTYNIGQLKGNENE